jgi:hypothetical protein
MNKQQARKYLRREPIVDCESNRALASVKETEKQLDSRMKHRTGNVFSVRGLVGSELACMLCQGYAVEEVICSLIVKRSR